MPGAKGGWITVRDAVKKRCRRTCPKPGKFRWPTEAAAAAADKAEAGAGPAAEQEGA